MTDIHTAPSLTVGAQISECKHTALLIWIIKIGLGLNTQCHSFADKYQQSEQYSMVSEI